MWLLGDVRVVRGTIAWSNPIRLRGALPAPKAAGETPSAPAPAEFDEEGRLWVFRYSRVVPKPCTIERDRIFEYMKRHRLPSETERQIRRDTRNAADFFTEVRELQTHGEVLSIEPLR